MTSKKARRIQSAADRSGNIPESKRVSLINQKFQAKYHLMVENKSIMTFYLKSVRDGFVFGIEIPRRDIHLTIIYNQEKNLIQPHLTDKNKDGETAQHPWGQYTDISLISREVLRRLRSWFCVYHHNRRGWIPTPYLVQRLQELVLPKEIERNVWHIPFIKEAELPDFEDERYWKRVRLREMVGKNQVVLIEGKYIIKYGYILDDRRMLNFSENQFDGFMDYLLQVFGVMNYLEYIKRKSPRIEFQKW